MTIIDMNDYLIQYVDKICNQRFTKDIMLVFNDYREDTKDEIIKLIHENVSYLLDNSILLDYRLIKIMCSMFLGLSWSMYRKGKNIYKNDESLRLNLIGNGKKYFLNEYIQNLNNELEFEKDIDDISIRYYTLYISKYNKEIIDRMKSVKSDKNIDEIQLKGIILNKMKDFSRNNVIMGIEDEFMNDE
ncbi:hypothetical protein GOQ27_16920 [Clostridium sp. D2Q-11]|uniref:Uncharacterized protein n=1 Tax=Anaeromonas frigoriresistens TaxID=2683708 RepID=A0A942UVT1_9FIRM|nr:hypothetical protein [Anaeromonas frigoriresistens]MBS4540164.1 hypothetical protein [Anaeromonas frigoriresistens]